MKSKNGDLPVTPTQYMDMTNGNGEFYCDQSGLTKREHFAAMAMQGLLSSASDKDGMWTNDGADNVAFEAVSFADALLAELEK